MTAETLEIILDSAALLLSAFMVIRQIPLLRVSGRQLTAALFLFAMVSLLLTYTYWLAYFLLRPDIRMPVAANMFGECAVFLLLSATLDSVFRDSRVPFMPQLICTLLYAAASVALWIVWSGEWIQDTLGGIVYGYFLCVCVHALVQTDALSRKEWIRLGISCAVIIAACVAELTLPDAFTLAVQIAFYAVMFALSLFFLGRTVQAVRNHSDPDRLLALSVSSHAWCMGSIYMSGGYCYYAAMFLSLLTLPLMMLALRREVEAA